MTRKYGSGKKPYVRRWTNLMADTVEFSSPKAI
jgi:hypothetical protein